MSKLMNITIFCLFSTATPMKMNNLMTLDMNDPKGTGLSK